MALNYLLDTSVLTRLGVAAVRAVVEPLAVEGRLVRPTICDLEVGFSARNGEEWDGLQSALGASPAVETTSGHVRRALQVQRLLAARGHRGRKVPDLLVAAAAEERRVCVLHYDADFDLIAEITGQPVRWVLSPGTVS